VCVCDAAVVADAVVVVDVVVVVVQIKLSPFFTPSSQGYSFRKLSVTKTANIYWLLFKKL
jgi:hypothetical protein